MAFTSRKLIIGRLATLEVPSPLLLSCRLLLLISRRTYCIPGGPKGMLSLAVNITTPTGKGKGHPVLAVVLQI